MTLYFMEQSAFDAFNNILTRCKIATAEDYASAKDGGTPMRINNGVAEIDIKGVLEPNRVKSYDYWGIEHTAYSDVIAQTAQAEAEGATKIIYHVNSGGGNVTGMLEAMEAMAGGGVETVARVSGVAASAAYMLASQADVIETTSKIDIIGSIGVVTGRYVWNSYKEITNTASPKKRPDVSTEEGQAAIREMLDDIYETTIPHVAKGRNTTVEDINKNYGQGNVMTARTALKNKMIDAIGFEKGTDSEKNNNAGDPAENRSKSMSIEKLKAEHPELYAQIFEAGQTAGKEAAMKMAKAHMNLAKGSGDTQKALDDIANGVDASDPECFSYHQMKAIKKAQVDARGNEAPEDLGEGEAPNASDEAKNVKAMKDAYAEHGIEIEVD